ncbi:hypothetical protein BCT19_14815 [Vibrio splendidus]|nr:hypothetical protein BCT19_14815 [Vibrio splendidus]
MFMIDFLFRDHLLLLSLGKRSNQSSVNKILNICKTPRWVKSDLNRVKVLIVRGWWRIFGRIGNDRLIKVAIFGLKCRHYFMFVGKLNDKEGETPSSHFAHFKLRQKNKR